MSENDLTAAFYGATPAVFSIEVPVMDTNEVSNEVVTIDFSSEIPEAEDITGFLENEEVPVQFWLAIAAFYAAKDENKYANEVVQRALLRFRGDAQTISKVHTFIAWLALKEVREATSQDKVRAGMLMVRESVKLAGSNNPLASLALAEALYLDKRDSEAARELEAVKEAGEGSKLPAYADLIRAKLQFRRGRIHDGLKYFQAVLVEQPLLKPDPRLGIGLCFWALKDRKLAVQAWERALQLDPQNTTAQLLLTLSRFDTAFKSISDEEFATQYGGALDSLKALLQKDSKLPSALLMRASYHFSREEFEQTSSLAEEVLSEAQNSTVARSDAHFWLGRVAYVKEQYTDAQKHFKDATTLNPSSLTASLGYAQALASRGELHDAISHLDKLSKTHPKATEVHYALGMLYSQRFETSADSEDSTRAISSLLEYIKLALQSNEPVAVSAYLTLSRFHEATDNVEALKYLNRAVEAFTAQGELAPAELMSNMGVLHFVQGSPESAKTLFESALADNDDDETGITLSYNLARSEENTDEDAAVEKYNAILEKTPGYVAAKMRSLFMQIMKSGNSEDMEKEVDTLLAENQSILEVRAFYSWYLKKTGRGAHNGLENTHNKETLTKYDSRDTYALISLANMYRVIAREIRPKNEQDTQRRQTSYHRAAQLFHKALATDPKNAFAAQGIAIVFAEEKQPSQALEIFRRVRDAVDSFSVHINLGHCLCELGQHAKAIQEYSIALARFSDETKDSRTLSLIGRAWFARGTQEKSLESYAKALEFSRKALDVSKEHSPKLELQMKYNVAFVQFSIAQFLVRLDISKRTVEDITGAAEGLNEAIEVFTSLAEETHAPVSPEILKQRATMGKNTLSTQLERILKEQEEYEVKFQAKISEAKRIREVERAKAELEEQKRKEEHAEKELKLREEFEKLQEQAKQWEAERESILVADDEEKPKRKKKNAVWTDEEASGDENGEKKSKPKKKRSKKKTDDDDEDKPIKPKKRRLTKREEKYKSKEIIEDSDEELEDYDDGSVLEQAEAKIDEQNEDGEEEEEEKVENDEDEEMS